MIDYKQEAPVQWSDTSSIWILYQMNVLLWPYLAFINVCQAARYVAPRIRLPKPLLLRLIVIKGLILEPCSGESSPKTGYRYIGVFELLHEAGNIWLDLWAKCTTTDSLSSVPLIKIRFG